MPHAPSARMDNEIDDQIATWKSLPEPSLDSGSLSVQTHLTAKQKGKSIKPLTPIRDETEDEDENEDEETEAPEQDSISITLPPYEAPPPPYLETVEDEYDARPLTEADKHAGPIFIDRRARTTKTKTITPVPERKTSCDDCLSGPAGSFCEHLSCSPESDESMPLPADFKDRSYAEEGPNPAPQLVVDAPAVTQPAPVRQSSWDTILQGQTLNRSGEFANEDFMMDPKVKAHHKKKRMRSPDFGDYALWIGAIVLMLGLVVPLIVCSKKLKFTVSLDTPDLKADPGNWSLLSSYELKFMHYCLNYRSSDGMQTPLDNALTTECHGMSSYVFNTTRNIELRPAEINTGMAQIADNLAQAQHQLVWSTWGLYVYLGAVIMSVSYANWQSLYEGEPEAFWLTFNSLLLLVAPPAPVGLSVYAITKIQNTFAAFVSDWDARGGDTRLTLTAYGAGSLQALYWAVLGLSLTFLVAIWVKYKWSPGQRAMRQSRQQTLFDEKKEIQSRSSSTDSGDVEAQTVVTAPAASRFSAHRPLGSNAPSAR